MDKLTNPEFIKAAAALATALSWPLLIIVLLWIGRDRLSSIINRLDVLKLPGGVEIQIHRALDRAVRESSQENAKENLLTERQFETAHQIGELALRSVRDLLINLASEYEGIRTAMSSGDERTRRMEVVATKMRALAVAGYPLLEEFSMSSSPGQRLAAVAMLQLRPDSEYIGWLSERFSADRPFIAYHAAVALLSAARCASAADRKAIRVAIATAKQGLRKDTDRFQVLDMAERELDRAEAENSVNVA